MSVSQTAVALVQNKNMLYSRVKQNNENVPNEGILAGSFAAVEVIISTATISSNSILHN